MISSPHIIAAIILFGIALFIALLHAGKQSVARFRALLPPEERKKLEDEDARWSQGTTL